MDIKLMHLCNHMHHILFQQKMMIGGFYNWHLVFQQPNNFVSYTSPDVFQRIMEEEFNVLLFGISRPEMAADTIPRVEALAKENKWSVEEALTNIALGMPNIVSERKKKDKKLKIVAHVDYAIQLWHSPMLKEFFGPYPLARILSNVDYIFTAEPNMGNWIHAITGRPVYFIPHPTNVLALKQMQNEIETKYRGNVKENIVRAVIHRYDNNWIAPFIVCETGINKLDPNSPVSVYIAMDGGQQFITELRSVGCEFVEIGTPHEMWLDKLSRTRILVDSYHAINTYGRSPVECACMKTPIIGSDVTYLQGILYPELTTKPNDVLKQRQLLVKLLNDKGYYDSVVDFAYKNVDIVNYDNSRKKFEGMINGELEPTWK